MAVKGSRDALRELRRVAVALAIVGALFAPGAIAAGDVTYLVHAPANPEPRPPLIVLLHGSGADERDMIGLWRDLPGGFVVVSPRAPFPDGGGYRWYRKVGSAPRPGDLALSRAVVDRVVANAVARFDVDPTRIFIAGFSQGAVMVYEVALREPDQFRGAAVLSGSLFASTSATLSAATDRTHAAFFVAHGTADPRIPLGAATAAKAALARLGVPTTLHLYPGMGHEIGPAETRDLDAWLIERDANAANATSR
jgi:phospholipase/carboxylesterase